MISYDDVRRISLALPGAYEQSTYEDSPSWRTKPRMFSWIRQDPEALVVWVESVELKEGLVESEPDKFFTTPHYRDRPIVLVRLEAVEADEATELITQSWRMRAPKALVKEWDEFRSR